MIGRRGREEKGGRRRRAMPYHRCTQHSLSRLCGSAMPWRRRGLWRSGEVGQRLRTETARRPHIATLQVMVAARVREQ